MILPKVRDPRFVTIRRGGTLTHSDHQLLALWAASCAEHVIYLFEAAKPSDSRPRQAIEQARAWAGGEITMTQARTAAGHANAAARDLSGAARHAAHAAGQAVDRRRARRASRRSTGHELAIAAAGHRRRPFYQWRSATVAGTWPRFQIQVSANSRDGLPVRTVLLAL